ncbi:MAG: hypothetical protein ACR2OW_08900 [Methyloligellaceae bacterium]
MPYIASLSAAIVISAILVPGAYANASKTSEITGMNYQMQDIYFQKSCPGGKVWNTKRKRCEYFPHPKGPK